MPRTSRTTARESRTVRQHPTVVEAVERYRRATREWAGRIAVLEVQRDRDLGRLEREVEAAEAEALAQLRAGSVGESPAPENGTQVAEPLEEPAPRRAGWRRRR